MSKARQLADLGNVYDDGALSNRNLIINGAMQVAQRGTSTTGVTSQGYYCVDRFVSPVYLAGTWTISQSTDAPDGFSNSFRYECTTANASLSTNSFLMARQAFEGQNLQSLAKGTSSAKQFTVSFWVKSNKTGTYVVECYDVDNSRTISQSYTVASSGVWEYKTITFSGDTAGLFDNDNGSSLELNWWLGSGTDYASGSLNTSWGANSSVGSSRATGVVNLADTIGNYWQLTGAQLEIGDTSTPFEHIPYSDQLARCQRYYYKTQTTQGGGYGAIFTGVVYSTADFYGSFTLPEEMRASPTATTSGATGWRLLGNTAPNCNAPELADASPRELLLKVSGSGQTGGTSWTLTPTSTNSWMSFDAEL